MSGKVKIKLNEHQENLKRRFRKGEVSDEELREFCLNIAVSNEKRPAQKIIGAVIGIDPRISKRYDHGCREMEVVIFLRGKLTTFEHKDFLTA